MSSGEVRKVAEIRPIVLEAVNLLRDLCQDIRVAGSLRRGKLEVGDVEIVALPKHRNTLLSRLDKLVIEGTITKARYGQTLTVNWGDKFRGFMYKGVRFELFLADAHNWGAILWLRTGPANCGEYVMGRCKAANSPARTVDGYWQHNGRKISVPTEKELFRLLGMPEIAPEGRSLDAYMRYLTQPNWPSPATFTYVDEPDTGASNAQHGMFDPPEGIGGGADPGDVLIDDSSDELFIPGAAAHGNPAEPLNIDTEGVLGISAGDLIGKSIAVLGITGSGKTNTTAVLIEEVINHFPTIIVDIEGEYYGLSEQFDVLIVGRSPNVHLELDPHQSGPLATFIYRHNLSVVLDVSEYSEDDRNEFLLDFFESLWEVAFSVRHPYCIVLEEAHESIPQSQANPLKTILKRIASRGRKRGLSLIAVSQRSAKVDKDVLTQANIVFLHKVVHPIDIGVYKEIIPLPPRQVTEMVTALDVGHVIVIHGHKITTAQIRVRHTFHVGATPTLDSGPAPVIRSVDGSLLDELRRLAPPSVRAQDAAPIGTNAQHDRLIQVEAENVRLENELRHAAQENERLHRRIAELEAAAVIPVNGHAIPVAVAIVPVVAEDDPLDLDYEAMMENNLRLATEQARTRQENKFKRFLSDAAGVKQHNRALAAWLLTQGDKAYSIEEIAAKTGYSKSTYSSNPPADALRLELVGRSGKRGDYRYFSMAHLLLQQDYPELDTNELVARLMTVLTHRGAF